MLGGSGLDGFAETSNTFLVSLAGCKLGADELAGCLEAAGFFSRATPGSREEGLGTCTDAAGVLSTWPTSPLLAAAVEADTEAATKLVRK